jgi:hypothetical protein
MRKKTKYWQQSLLNWLCKIGENKINYNQLGTPNKHLLWCKITSLTHYTAHHQPHTVGNDPNIFFFFWILIAWVGILPIGWRQPDEEI